MDKRRILPLEGGVNFRDLGGYTSEDGRKVKWGKIFRTAKMSELSSRDLDYLAERKLSTIVDFRSKAEVEAEPDKVPNQAVDLNIPAEFYDETKSTVDFNNLALEMKPKGLGKETMLKVYEELIDSEYSNQAYRQFFDLLLKEENTLSFHCTAGKDRTGVGAMLVLAALGVNEEQILHDYLLTNRLYGQTTEQEVDKIRQIDDDPVLLDNIRAIWTVNSDYMQKALDTIKNLSGNPVNYLQERLQLSLGDISTLRDKYLFVENF